MTTESSETLPSSKLPILPSTFVKTDDLSIAERRDVIKVYNATIAKFATTDLPRVKFNFRTNHSHRMGLSKHKQAHKSYAKGIRKSISRPIFTEGISSHSKKQDPVFYVKSSSVVSSNLPHGVHYSKDKSKIVIETKPRTDKKNVASLPASRLSWADSNKTPRSLSVTRNHTLLLPKVHIEKEINIIDYVRSGYNTARDNAHFISMVPTLEEIQKPHDSAIQLNNSTNNTRGPDKPPAEQSTLHRESSNLSSLSGKNRAEMSSRKGPRINAGDIHKVSVGDDLNLSFSRNYVWQSVPPSVVSVDNELERQSTFETRAALSTPGRTKPRRNTKHSDGKTADSKYLPSSTFKAQNSNSKLVAWENSAPLSEGQSEEADIMGAPYDSNKLKGVIKKYTIGDPVKDSNVQDKKLDKSNLMDLYSRGVVREHLSNVKPQTNRVTVQMLKRDDRSGKFGGSRASGLSTIPGNPPPSLATYLASPGYDHSGKSHHPLLSPEMTYISQGLVVEGSTLNNSPEAKSARKKGKLMIDGALLSKIESDKERDIAETFIDKYEKSF